ncbi:TonB-dependent receptor [Capnocytophaga stomatis]|uniref:TonB-dependent receptor n=1 Tax=Capnocytophaga stomatis TaxID=1848904 RepID=UPI001AC88481|nr:TonB-dependent receptor [Capnocytophaga stomatis]GIM50274.1 prevent-host-death protein [Capnocytophaga stomatis]
MKRFIYFILVVFLNLSGVIAYGQAPIVQNLKGKVFDANTHEPLMGATIVIENSNPVLGTTTDVEGNFFIERVPIGRQTIKVSFIGYETSIISELMITSAKEVVLEVALKEDITQIEEVVVQASLQKERPLNAMATVSARSFSVEETTRYAGGMNDPARLVSAYAGVTTGNLQDNSIIVRGNAPQGVAWRLEGVEIPTPHHFAGANVAGGGIVTLFSNQMLANSDFFTAAFPAEYGDALAAVFDMKLRTGNSSKHEHTAQVGILGLDFFSEGPISKKSGASYIFNYRYSTFGLLGDLNLIPSEQKLKYQDLSFKFNFPTKRAGTFSFWGIGGIDHTYKSVEKNPSKWKVDFDRIENNWDTHLGATGITHRINTGENSFLQSNLAFSGVSASIKTERLSDDLQNFTPDMDLKNTTKTFTLASVFNQRFSPKSMLKAGFTYKRLFYNFDLSSTQDHNLPLTYAQLIDDDGYTDAPELFTQLKYNLSSTFLFNVGLHATYFGLGKEFVLEPRFGAQWAFHPKHSLSLGYGKHSRPESLNVYFLKINNERPNKELKLPKAHHFVLGYDWKIGQNLRLKAEAYYQHIYDALGEEGSSYSLLNFKQDYGLNKKLENNTLGRNYGIDITLERFLNKHYYYLLTASLFDAQYKGGDNIWRNTRYNKNYVFNALFGKEFFFKDNRKVLDINARVTLTGGERYSPILESHSIANERIITDETRAFEERFPAILYADFTLNYRINHRKSSSVFSFQMKNIFGAPIYLGHNYNFITKKIQFDKANMVIPNISYKIEF